MRGFRPVQVAASEWKKQWSDCRLPDMVEFKDTTAANNGTDNQHLGVAMEGDADVRTHRGISVLIVGDILWLIRGTSGKGKKYRRLRKEYEKYCLVLLPESVPRPTDLRAGVTIIRVRNYNSPKLTVLDIRQLVAADRVRDLRCDFVESDSCDLGILTSVFATGQKLYLDAFPLAQHFKSRAVVVKPACATSAICGKDNTMPSVEPPELAAAAAVQPQDLNPTLQSLGHDTQKPTGGKTLEEAMAKYLRPDQEMDVLTNDEKSAAFDEMFKLVRGYATDNRLTNNDDNMSGVSDTLPDQHQLVAQDVAHASQVAGPECSIPTTIKPDVGSG